MKCVDIIYGKYLSDDRRVTIGGIQTYITDLCAIINEMGYKVRIIQFSKENYQHELSTDITVIGYKIDRKKKYCRYQELYDMAVRSRKDESTLTIFATDTIIPKRVSGNCIVIQHGVFWDIPRVSNKTLLHQFISRTITAYRIVRRLKNADVVVCVDYNFLNWYRTQINHVPGSASVIPNYTRIAPIYEKKSEKINIIFARRLFAYRGTRVFTEAVSKLLDEGAAINVTIAGTGEDEKWMHEKLDKYSNVHFLTYESHESLDIHKDQHIAVVPTVGSEGTSLSLLEAMSAQCAVICTNVGGMTNIVIDGYNGLMVNSGDVDQLYDAIKKLIEDIELRNCLAKNGYETVKQGFNIQKWQERWKKVIKDVAL